MDARATQGRLLNHRYNTDEIKKQGGIKNGTVYPNKG